MLGGLWSTGSLAQDKGGQASADSFGIEEIIVTARKRQERLQDVPDTIAAFTARTIQNSGIESVGDVSLMVTNFTLLDQQDAGSVLINIRGIGQVRNGEAPVAMVIDGVQVAATQQFTQELFDVERIEVLKGPQGSLYGRNAIGGAIIITTKKPDNEFSNMAGFGYANGDDILLKAFSSGPIVKDKLFYRLAGRYQNYDGLIENVFLHRKVDFKEDFSLRGRLLFMPTNNLTLDARIFYSTLDAGADYYIALPDGDVNNTSAPLNSDEFGTGKRDIEEYALKINYDASAFEFTSATAYTSTDNAYSGDVDYSPVPFFRVTQDWDIESWSQELRFTSPTEQRLRWVAGFSYFKRKTTLATTPELNFGFGFVPFPSVTTDRNNEIGVFGQINYDITSRIEFTLGARYDSDRRKQLNVLTGGRAKKTFDLWQPKGSLAFKVTDDAMVYATIARGFRSGGFNVPSTVFAPLYKQEESTNYELGFKTSWLGNRLIVNGAAFYIDYTNQQFFFLRFDPVIMAPVQGITNIDSTEVTGLELEIQARLAPGLDVTAGVGLMDSKIKKFSEIPAFVGNKANLTYGWSYNMSMQYTKPLSDDMELILRADYSARGDNYWYIDNLDKQKAVNLFDLRTTLRWKNLSLSGYAKNLFNEKYFTEVGVMQNSGLATDIGFPATPRRYGVEVQIRF